MAYLLCTSVLVFFSHTMQIIMTILSQFSELNINTYNRKEAEKWSGNKCIYFQFYILLKDMIVPLKLFIYSSICSVFKNNLCSSVRLIHKRQNFKTYKCYTSLMSWNLCLPFKSLKILIESQIHLFTQWTFFLCLISTYFAITISQNKIMLLKNCSGECIEWKYK